MRQVISGYITDLFNLFYPHVCVACSRKLLGNEDVICLQCENELPRANHWNDIENPLMKRFWGRVELQGAAALFQFQKGAHIQHMLHQLKYKGRKDVGAYLGKIMGELLTQNESIINGLDLVVPVPLHKKKLKQRGYNQCDSFAESIANELSLPWSSTALIRPHENISQTKKNRFDRYSNVAGIFAVPNESQLKGKHILLVDDVVTTGATAEACMHIVLSVPDTKVSFAAMAVALK